MTTLTYAPGDLVRTTWCSETYFHHDDGRERHMERIIRRSLFTVIAIKLPVCYVTVMTVSGVVGQVFWKDLERAG